MDLNRGSTYKTLYGNCLASTQSQVCPIPFTSNLFPRPHPNGTSIQSNLKSIPLYHLYPLWIKNVDVWLHSIAPPYSE
jgi:hypothetical protein